MAFFADSPVKHDSAQLDAYGLHPARALCSFTASQTPTIVGLGYDSTNKLLREMVTGEKPAINPRQQELFDHGHRTEPEARRALSTMIRAPVTEHEFWTRTCGHIVIGATPDGFVREGLSEEDEMVVELKCPVNATALSTRDNKFWTWFVQVQTQLFVTARTFAVLFVYHEHLPPAAWAIVFSGDFWIEYMMPRVREFDIRVRDGKLTGDVKEFPRRANGWRDDFFNRWEPELLSLGVAAAGEHPFLRMLKPTPRMPLPINVRASSSHSKRSFESFAEGGDGEQSQGRSCPGADDT